MRDPQGVVVLICFLPLKSRRRLAHDILYISATHASLVMMSQTQSKWQLPQPCWFSLYHWRAEEGWLMMSCTFLLHMPALSWCHRLGQNSSSHGHVFTIFTQQIFTHQTINPQKNCCECSFYSCAVDRLVMLLCLESILLEWSEHDWIKLEAWQ